jgi:hypothetical protein
LTHNPISPILLPSKSEFLSLPEVPVGHVDRGDFMLRLDSLDVGFIDQGIQDVLDPVPIVPEIILDPQLFETLGDDLSALHLGHLFSPFPFPLPEFLVKIKVAGQSRLYITYRPKLSRKNLAPTGNRNEGRWENENL